MATYNRALDLLGLALIEQAKGNAVNASTLLAMAAKTKSAQHALRMIEATNNQAIEAAAKARVAAAVESLPIVAAAGDAFESTDENTMKLLRQGTATASAAEVTASTVPSAEVVEVDARTLKIAMALARVLAEDEEAK